MNDNINIRISWAVNCAIEVLKKSFPNGEGEKRENLEKWTDYFLDLFDRKKFQLENKHKKSLDQGQDSFVADLEIEAEQGN